MYEENSDVKQRLIAIGRKEFLEQGYVKASMRNISAAANVTTGAIYFFFHNKEDFFRAILDEIAGVLRIASWRLYNGTGNKIYGTAGLLWGQRFCGNDEKI